MIDNSIDHTILNDKSKSKIKSDKKKIDIVIAY